MNSLIKFIFISAVVGSITSIPVHAGEVSDEAQDIHFAEAEIVESVDQVPEVTVKEIRKYVEGVGAGETCLDEILKRRKQLILKLAITPLTAPIMVGGTIYVGGISGAFLGGKYGAPGSWGDLAGAVTGIVLGGLGSAIFVGVDTTVTAVKLRRLNLIIKALGENYLCRQGNKSERLYEEYRAKSGESPLPRDAFFHALPESDHTGALCDGSMLKKKIVRLGPKLKYRVATSKDFIRFLNH